MIRWPYANYVRRFFPDTVIDLSRPRHLTGATVAAMLGLAVCCAGAFAQKTEKGSADHIKAVTSAVDANFVKANTSTSKDWPTIGLDYAETVSASSTRSIPTTSRISG